MTDPPSIDSSVEELFGEGPRGRRKLRILDGPNPLACPICGTVGEWVRDEEDTNKFLCARDGTHIMTQVSDEEAELAGQLQDMAWKIDNEGLDYFLQHYIDMVPDECPDGYSISLVTFAREARLALELFERHAREMCETHGVEYDQ